MGEHPAGTGPRVTDGDSRAVCKVRTQQKRLAGTLITCVLALGSAHVKAQAGATPTTVRNEIAQPAAPPPTADDVCRTLEQAAAENALPLEFFARVIWQESRFNARALSSKGAKGIAQFMPQTAHWHGLRNPFNPIEALRHSAGYLRELRERFGNLGLAAAAYNAGPGRVSAWLTTHHLLPGETRNYVAMITGWTADEWASPSPPQMTDTTIPQGVPCTRLANLAMAPRAEVKQLAANAQEHIALPIDARADSVRPTVEARTPDDAESTDADGEKSTAPSSPQPPAPRAALRPDASPTVAIPRWGVWLAANLSESKAWALYRERLTRFASLIEEREPVVLFKQMPGMGTAKRYIIAIADDDRGPLDKFCEKLSAAGSACDVMRNEFGH
jgi:hypothetical protein